MEDYEKLWKMGDGGQGKIFCVKHKQTSKEYAMKEIVCGDKAAVNFALKEIKVLIQLSHKNIVQYVDFFLEYEPKAMSQITVCIVMELCQGGDLQDKIKKAKREFMETGKSCFEESQALEYIRQIAEALFYVHERGFLHRDMKPTNVFFSSMDDVKLGDFGLAANVGFGRESAVGTPYYFAPELLLQQRYDSKVDIWGFGVVLYEFLTLRERPLNSEVIQDPSSVNSVIDTIVDMGFSRGLGELVRDMLQRQPSDRPTIGAILRRLKEWGVGNGIPRAASTVRASSASRRDEIAKPRPPPIDTHQPGPAPRDARHAPHPQMQAPRTGPTTNNKNINGTVPSEVSTPVVVTTPLEGPSSAASSFAGAPTRRGSATILRHYEDNAKPVAQQPNPQILQVRTNLPAQEKPAATRQPNNTNAQPITIDVPKDCPTVHEALQLPNVGKIIVAGGFTITEPLVINSNVQLVGLEPAPTIDVSSLATAVTINSESGKLSNFAIAQSKQKRASGERKPFAIEVTTGQWRIDRCSIQSLVGSGIGVAGENANPTVTNCRIHSCKQAGIFVYDGGKGTYQRNTIFDCEYAGILMKRNADPKIMECDIKRNGETGVFCHESFGTVETNTIHDNKGCGIVIKGSQSSPKVRSNKIYANEQAGVFCCDSCEGSIVENEITSNTKAGVLIKTSANPIVSRNKITKGLETGVYVFDSGMGKLEGNDISENANAGVLVTTDGKPFVSKNKICRNTYEGVWICKKGRGTFEMNDLRSNSKGTKDIEDAGLVQWVQNRES